MADFDSAGAADAIVSGLEGGAPDQPAPSSQPQGTTAPTDSQPAQPVDFETQYKNLQPEYTRLTQRIAPLKELGDDVDMGEVAKAYQFYNALENDPDYQYTVAQHLQNQLSQMGYQFGNAPAAQAAPVTPDFAEEDSGGDPVLASQLKEIRETVQTMQQEQQMLSLANRMAREEAAIRDQAAQAGNTLSDEDIADIYRNSVAFNGNLIQAHQFLQQRDQRIAARLMNQAGAVPDALQSVGNGGGGVPEEAPPEIHTFEDATKAAIARVRAQFD